MKKTLVVAVANAAIGTLAFAGGDIAPVEPAVAVVPVVTESDRNGFYAGVAYNYLSHDIDYAGHGTKSEMDFNAIMLEVGYQFNRYVAVEGRYTTSLGDDIDDVASSSDATSYGLFVKPMLHLSHRATVYGLIGYSKTDAGSTFKSIDIDLDESGISWGGGFSLDMNEDWTIFGEYVRWYDDSVSGFDHVVDGFNAGVSYRF